MRLFGDQGLLYVSRDDGVIHVWLGPVGVHLGLPWCSFSRCADWRRSIG